MAQGHAGQEQEQGGRLPALSRLPRVLASVCAFAVTAGLAAPPGTLADRITRAERMQDWQTVATLSSRFALAEREDLFVLTAILNACVARKCDEAAFLKR